MIRKISAATQQVSTIPIQGSLLFYSPYNLTIDKRSKSLYVTDFNAHVAKVTADGNMSIIFNDVMPLAGIALSPDDHLFIDNTNTGEVFRLDTTGHNKTIFATGIVTPRNIFFDKDNIMYIAGYGIYKMNSNGSYTIVVDQSKFHGWEIALDTSGNFYEADHVNNVIRMFAKNGNITTIAGNGNPADVDGIGLNASFDEPQGIAIDKDGNLFVTTYNYDHTTGNKVRKLSFK